jgi:hypothetical protein
MVFLGARCDLSEDSESPRTLTGSWQGPVATQDSSYTLTLSLQQSPGAGAVSGTGRLARDTTTWEFTVEGTFAQPSLFLTLQFQSARPSQLEGDVDEDLTTIEGEIFGGPASFDGASVTLERQ